MLYVVPSTASVSPSLVHVTLVAGESVDVQARVREAESYVRLDTVGGAEGMNVTRSCGTFQDVVYLRRKAYLV